jgi:voltage-gated potassium channel
MAGRGSANREMEILKRMSSRLRYRVYEILDQSLAGDRVAALVHRVIVALIIGNISAVVLETVPSLSARFEPLFLSFEAISVSGFFVEYALRLWASVEHPELQHLPAWRARLRYALYPSATIDLLAILPFLLGVFLPSDLRAFLVFRLARYFKLARYSPGMASLIDAVWAERRALIACLVILTGAVLVAACAMHLAESNEQPDNFGSIPAAMYWAIITLTTVGYGDVVPITPLGKVVASITAVAGLVMLGLPAGIIASAFAREIQRRDFMITMSMVSRVPLFSGLDGSAIAEIMRVLKARTVEQGNVICRRGDPATSMYFIAFGEVECLLPRGTVRLEEGQFFGEVAVLRRAERAATIRALIRTKLLVLDSHDLHVIMNQHPEIATRIEQIAEDRFELERVGQFGDMLAQELDRPPSRS